MKLVFATGNIHKVIEAQKVLGNSTTLIMPKDLGMMEDIPENGNTLDANAEEKCKYLWNKFGLPCFADDTGLEVDILDGAPGVYTARYAGLSKEPDANMNKLLKELEKAGLQKGYDVSRQSIDKISNYPDKFLNSFSWRSARFRTAVALIIQNELHRFEGILDGYIAYEKSGIQGFGYDPIFIPKGYEVTLAELSLDEKNIISHRGKAVRALSIFVKSITKE